MKQQQWKAGLIVALLAAMTGSVALAAAGAAAPAKESAPAAPAKPAAKAGARRARGTNAHGVVLARSLENASTTLPRG